MAFKVEELFWHDLENMASQIRINLCQNQRKPAQKIKCLERELEANNILLNTIIDVFGSTIRKSIFTNNPNHPTKKS